ncbi:1855_t:CDS:2 [Ambispora leptoticha]|uniref:1855_t:CDS:1 n=1 Tax=Ambispora leptoticha TaxID=144679 RepID=A0A9N9FPH9_9GLOM|nr:1855_t:CDS:2 [Ambispora leptoticha]
MQQYELYDMPADAISFDLYMGNDTILGSHGEAIKCVEYSKENSMYFSHAA